MRDRAAVHGVSYRPVLQAGPAAALLAGLMAAGGSTQAQQNVGNTAQAVAAYCDATLGSTICAQSPSPPGNLAQVAPDRFVVQGATALHLVNQQFSMVSRRVQERLVVASTARGAAAPRQPQPILLAVAVDVPLGSLFAQAAAPGSAALAGAVRQPSLGFYMRAERGANRVKPTDFDRGFDLRATSVTLGGDVLLNPQTVLGLSYAHDDARSSLDTGDGGQPGSTTTRGHSVSLYAAYRPSAYSYIDATLLAGRNKYATVRRFDFAISEIKDTTSGATRGRQHGLSLGGGFSFAREHLTFGPYARVDFARIRVAAFTEEGGQDLNLDGTSNNLSVDAQRFDSLTSRLGAQASHAVSTGWGVLVPYAFAEWVHQYRQDRTRQLSAALRDRLALNPDDRIIIDTTPVDRNYGNIGLGLAAHLGIGRSAALYYQSEVGRAGQRANQLTGELRLEF
jgi:outer membrane lipase/esterase